MSLESSIAFVFNGQSCTHFNLEWVFDPYFSAAIIQEHDKNADGVFSSEEAENVYNGAFINLRKYGYFIYLRKGNTRVHPDAVENFVPIIRDQRLVYTFSIDLEDTSYSKDFSVAIFDSTFYCRVDHAPSGISIQQQNTAYPVPDFNKTVNKDYPVYYDPLAPVSDMTIHDSWKPGLETAYPEEIRVFF